MAGCRDYPGSDPGGPLARRPAAPVSDNWLAHPGRLSIRSLNKNNDPLVYLIDVLGTREQTGLTKLGTKDQTMRGGRILEAAGLVTIMLMATGATSPGVLTLNPATLPKIGMTDPRYESYNFDLVAITGMAPHSAIGAGESKADSQDDAMAHKVLSGVTLEKPLDLSNPRLRKLAAGLAPAYLRVSGTAANSVWFENEDAATTAPPPAGYGSVLTRAQWAGVISFAKASDAKLVTSFTVNSAVRDAKGVWTPKVAAPLVAFTKARGGSIYAAELFNEPNLPSYGGVPAGYNAAMFARDQAAYRAFAQSAAPAMKLAGPGDVTAANLPMPGALTAEAMLSANPGPKFDVISYHFYPAVAARCAPAASPVGTTPAAALSEEWLARTDNSFQAHKTLRDKYAPGAPIWNTETAGAACSGAVWDMTFLDSFRYLDQLGRLAKQGADVVFHQTLVGGNYGLLDPQTLAPRPNYWAAWLWKRFMGATVLDAGPILPGFHIYAHCAVEGHGAVALLAINNGDAAGDLSVGGNAQVYTLTADTLQSPIVKLNGTELALGARDSLPRINPLTRTGGMRLPAHTISFVILRGAANPACR
jgi:hypothetical protein